MIEFCQADRAAACIAPITGASSQNRRAMAAVPGSAAHAQGQGICNLRANYTPRPRRVLHQQTASAPSFVNKTTPGPPALDQASSVPPPNVAELTEEEKTAKAAKELADDCFESQKEIKRWKADLLATVDDGSEFDLVAYWDVSDF